MVYKIEDSIGSSKSSRGIKYHFHCVECGDIWKSTNSALKVRKSNKCKRCCDLIKLTKGRIVGNCNRSRPYEALYNMLVKHCEERDKYIKLSYEDFLYFTQFDKCFYCLDDISWTKYNLSVNGSRTNMDRKDHRIGYLKSNIVQCCWKCNNAKSNKYTFDDWYGMTAYYRYKK